MTIAIGVLIIGRDCLSPMSTTLEVNVINVGASIDDVSVNTLTTIVSIEVFVECPEVETISVRDTS